MDVGWSLTFVGKHSWIWGGGCPVHLEEVVSRAWKAEMVGRGVVVLVRGVEDQNAEFVCVCVCFPQFCRYLKGKPNNRLKLRGKNRQLERIDVFPVEIFVYLHVVDRLWCRLCIEVIPETAAKNACYSAFHSTNNQQQTTLIASNKQQPAPFSFTRILYFRKEWSPTTPSAALKSLMVYWSENLRFLGLWPLKSYRNPIGKDRFFQPPYFRGELLNFGGVTSQPWQQCSVVVFHHRC